MTSLAPSLTSLLPFALALGFASGLNVYLAVFLLGALERLHWAVLPSELASLDSTPVLIGSSILLILSFVGDKVPGIDVIWNAAHTFVRIPASAVLIYAAGSHLPPAEHLLLTAIGGMMATVAHSSKTAARLAVTASPEPFSNVVLSTGEDVVSGSLTWLATTHPQIAAVTSMLFLVGALAVCWISIRLLSRNLRRLRDVGSHGWRWWQGRSAAAARPVESKGVSGAA